MTRTRQMAYGAYMTQAQPEMQSTPDWTLGWRLQRSLAWGAVSVQEMADELDVSRSTISRWCNDHGAPPKMIYLRAWAHKTNVPLDWLVEGDERLPRLDSNQQPFGLWAERGPVSTTELTQSTKPIADLRRAIRTGKITRTDDSDLRRVS